MNTKKNYIIRYPQSGCTKDEGIMVINAIRWFLNRYNMQITDFDGYSDVDDYEGDHENITITTNARQYKDIECYGQCYEWDQGGVDYVIDIAVDQSVRDMLATIFHECVHLWQWERGTWKGEGEHEAEQLQYELADEYWRCGNV
jgi:hypothetical protein